MTVTTTCYGSLLHDTALPDEEHLLFQALGGHRRRIRTRNLYILSALPTQFWSARFATGWFVESALASCLLAGAT